MVRVTFYIGTLLIVVFALAVWFLSHRNPMGR